MPLVCALCGQACPHLHTVLACVKQSCLAVAANRHAPDAGKDTVTLLVVMSLTGAVSSMNEDEKFIEVEALIRGRRGRLEFCRILNPLATPRSCQLGWY